jgi:Holliday junction resolvase RusA-like endonuclease
MRITLLGEPRSTQTIYGLSCRGAFATRYMTAKGKSIKEGYQWEAKSQYKGKLLKRNIGMEVKLYFGTKRKQDIDNFNKIVYDALSGIVWEDDSQIQQVLTEKCYDKKNPRVELEVYEIL